MSDDMDILITPEGDIRFVHDDRLAEVFEDEPQQQTRRASHVEPANTIQIDTRFEPIGGGHVRAVPIYFAESGWAADMRPSDGPVLGPTKTRQAALDAERAWLREHKGL